MNAVRGYEQAEVRGVGANFERVLPGGHVCSIVSAKAEQNQNGSDVLVLALEIADGGPQDGMMRVNWETNKLNNPGAKWPCTYRQFVTDREGNCSPYFKGLIKCIEESNSGYKWDWQEARLAGKKVGFIFQEQEYMKQNGDVGTVVRPAYARSVETIRNGVDVPPVRRLQNRPAPVSTAFTEATDVDDDLPF